MVVRSSVVLLAITLAVSRFADGQNPNHPSLPPLLISHDFDGALAMSDALLKQQPNNAQLWLIRALSLRGLKRTKESLEAFNHVLVLKPENLPSLRAHQKRRFFSKIQRRSR